MKQRITKRICLYLGAIICSWLMAANANAQSHEGSGTRQTVPVDQEINQLENTINNLQAELARLKSQSDWLPAPQGPPPTPQSIPANELPSLDLAPAYEPGVPGIVIDDPTVIPGSPGSPGSPIVEVPTIVESPAVQIPHDLRIVPVPAPTYVAPAPRTEIRIVPVYRYQSYRPYGGYDFGSDADCPYGSYRARRGYRPPYSAYDDRRDYRY